MKTFSGRELCDFLGNYGFVFVRQKGSHIILKKTTDKGSITLPVPDHKEIKIGTLRSIIRRSGLPKHLFD